MTSSSYCTAMLGSSRRKLVCMAGVMVVADAERCSTWKDASLPAKVGTSASAASTFSACRAEMSVHRATSRAEKFMTLST